MTTICLIPGLVLYGLASVAYLILSFGYPAEMAASWRHRLAASAKIFTILGVLLQVSYLITFYFFERGMPLVTGLSDSLFFISLGSVVLFLWLLFRYEWFSLGAFFLPLAFILFVLALDRSHDSFYLLYLFGKSRWLLLLHLFFALMSVVLLFGCFILGIVFWLHERRLKAKKIDALALNLPPLLLNEKRALNFLKVGFVCLTFVLITGSMLLTHVDLSFGQKGWHIALAIVAWGFYAVAVNRRWLGPMGHKILLLSFLGFFSLAALILWN